MVSATTQTGYCQQPLTLSLYSAQKRVAGSVRKELRMIQEWICFVHALVCSLYFREKLEGVTWKMKVQGSSRERQSHRCLWESSVMQLLGWASQNNKCSCHRDACVRWCRFVHKAKLWRQSQSPLLGACLFVQEISTQPGNSLQGNQETLPYFVCLWVSASLQQLNHHNVSLGAIPR